MIINFDKKFNLDLFRQPSLEAQISAIADDMELKREFGQEVAKKSKVAVSKSEKFSNISQGISFLKKQMSPSASVLLVSYVLPLVKAFVPSFI